MGNGGRVVKKAKVALFALLCFGYVRACGRLMVIAGWGFLTGLLPAAPILFAAARRIARGEAGPKTLLLVLLSFTVHFWTSALVVLWRANAGTEIADS